MQLHVDEDKSSRPGRVELAGRELGGALNVVYHSLRLQIWKEAGVTSIDQVPVARGVSSKHCAFTIELNCAHCAGLQIATEDVRTKFAVGLSASPDEVR